MHFTKTDFKRAIFCPTSVYYHNDQYINIEVNDDFIKSLMDGGYQVEFLAKDYFKDGHDLKKYSIEDNLNITRNLLKHNENITLFEPCFEFNGFLVRIDIFEKNGNNYRINEVKAKSFDFSKDMESEFLTKTATLKADWKEYVYDVFFQHYVVSNALQTENLESCLFLLDKNTKCSVDGLHQKYLIRENKSIEITDGEIGQQLMKCLPLNNIFQISDLYHSELFGMEFIAFIEYLRDNMKNGIKTHKVINGNCKNCPFFTTQTVDEKKNGFFECWSYQTKLSNDALTENPSVLDLWNYRSANKLIDNHTYLIKDIDIRKTFYVEKVYKKPELTVKYTRPEILKDGEFTIIGRQMVQTKCIQTNSTDIRVRKRILKSEIQKWRYPLNMIDFETISTAIPFNKHLKPYELVAFQFSHHIIYEDGRVEHKSQYINKKRGGFPSFKFIRALKRSLEKNNGDVFMYSPHENSTLNHILRQLHTPLGDKEKDKEELIDFIKSITTSNEKSVTDLTNVQPWWGQRSLIDMWDILKKTYYNPYTNGSNSIKYVLPAILTSSEYLQNKYSKPIYGYGKLKSKNFRHHQWINRDDNGNIINPYKTLPVLFDGAELIKSERIANGGDAMIAYAKMQYYQMSEQERKNTIKSLLMYCELDTFAMVMLYEHWFYDILNGKL